MMNTDDTKLNGLLTRYSVQKVEPVFSTTSLKNDAILQNIVKLTISNAQSTAEMVRHLQQDPSVVWAEPNHSFKIHFTPNDSLYSQQWAMQNIRMEAAWELEKGNPEIIVGVIDTGVDYYLELHNLRDVWEQPLKNDLGNKILIQREISSIEEIIVYPNPFKRSNSENKIRFGNVPRGCLIFIYTTSGQRVAKLEQKDFDGGLDWNLSNEFGKQVGSGVYIYNAQISGKQKTGKFLILK